MEPEPSPCELAAAHMEVGSGGDMAYTFCPISSNLCAHQVMVLFIWLDRWLEYHAEVNRCIDPHGVGLVWRYAIICPILTRKYSLRSLMMIAGICGINKRIFRSADLPELTQTPCVSLGRQSAFALSDSSQCSQSHLPPVCAPSLQPHLRDCMDVSRALQRVTTDA